MEHKGVLILFLSNYRKQEEQQYHIENSNEVFSGTQTNDAPVKYLLSYAAKTGKAIHKILCIASNAVRQKKNEEELSDYDRFKYMVNTYIQKKRELDHHDIYVPEIIAINYDENNLDTSSRARDVYRQVAENLQKETDFFVDYTGGFRDISFLMTTIVRYLEYQGIICRKIVYSNAPNKVIHQIDCVYEMFRLLNGVDQFVRTGNAKLLSECYESEANAETKKLLRKIVEFSEIIALCDVKKIDAVLPEISDALISYEKSKPEDTFFGAMFYSMIPVIREKLYLSENCKMEYPQLIHWCLDNNMIQQAITLYVEKMPKFYYDSGILQRPDKPVKTTLGESQEVALFYRKLFETWSEEKEIQEFWKLLDMIEIPLWGDFRIQQIDRLKIKCQKKLLRQAVENLKKFMEKYYYGGVGKKRGDVACPKIYGEKVVNFPQNAIGFLNRLKQDTLWQHYFIFNDLDDYKKMSCKDTYQKKVRALDKLKKKREEGDQTSPARLYEMMKYYCALKLIRNKINHASEDDMQQEEAAAIERLEQSHGICMDISFDNVKDLLSKGIEAYKID